VVIKEDGTKQYNLPDADIDVQSSQRQRVIQWLRDEYGQANIGQICTFGMLKGRQALKDVCKVLGTVPEVEVNKITALMPEEHIIDDELRELAEDFGYRSIIQYCLVNMAKTFAPYAVLKEDGTIGGVMGKEFTLARSAENIPRNIGIHAGGVIVNLDEETLAESLPMVKSGDVDKVIAIDMHNIIYHSGVKIDLLGSLELDTIATMVGYLNTEKYLVHTKQ
jgi:DNA polymerase-3 subunit alpha